MNIVAEKTRGTLSAVSNLASSLSSLMRDDPGWLVRQADPAGIIDKLEIDGEIQALDIAIYLNRQQAYELALRQLGRVKDRYPESELVHYQIALNAAGVTDHEQAIKHARLALAYKPANLEYRSLLIRACAVAGRYTEARDAMRSAEVPSRHDYEHTAVIAQFTDFCELHPFSMVKEAHHRLRDSGSFCKPQGAAEAILSAVQDRRAFSMVRLGDGEGAWLFIDPYDEGRFASLYRANRLSFLNDWFGSDRLIDDQGFRAFARGLQATFATHDLVGIPNIERLKLEEGFLSYRGISTSVNVMRFLGLLDRVPGNMRLISNSANLALEAHTDFYQRLFMSTKDFGIITSQKGLKPLMEASGLNVVREHIVPGDSRNFHQGDDGSPECQYPAHVLRIDAELAAKDFRGVVFLVAAGFVGKQYLTTIRSRGGIAIDLGSLADHWARNGLPG